MLRSHLKQFGLFACAVGVIGLQDYENSGVFDHITVEDARWVGETLSRLSNKQLSDIFRAANYTPEETRTLADAVRARINALVNLPR